jgi:hypothetical protein
LIFAVYSPSIFCVTPAERDCAAGSRSGHSPVAVANAIAQ